MTSAEKANRKIRKDLLGYAKKIMEQEKAFLQHFPLYVRVTKDSDYYQLSITQDQNDNAIFVTLDKNSTVEKIEKQLKNKTFFYDKA